MATGSFHHSLFLVQCSENGPTTLLGCLYFYDFSTKCIAFFGWPRFWGHRLGYYVHKCSWQQATEDAGARGFESSLTFSSCWGFELMNLFHLNKLLKLLFLLNLYLCLCSKTGQRICSRNWPFPCFEGERWLGVPLKKRPLRCFCGSKPTESCAFDLAKKVIIWKAISNPAQLFTA